MIDSNGKTYNLPQLQKELIAAGLDVSNGLGSSDKAIFPYSAPNENGIAEVSDFHNNALAQQVFDAHVPQPTASEIVDGDLRASYKAAVARLQDIVQNGGTYTAVQVRAAMVDLAQIQLKSLRWIGQQTGSNGVTT